MLESLSRIVDPAIGQTFAALESTNIVGLQPYIDINSDNRLALGLGGLALI